MSDLEADLYGDLYGNDEAEFTEEQAEEAVKVEESPTSRLEPTPPPRAAPSSTAPLTTAISTGSSANAQSHSSPTSSALPIQTSEGYTSPTTQQIPTYQERQEQDYTQASMPHVDGGYANQADRPVRPSEMKEEGHISLVACIMGEGYDYKS